MISVNQDLVKKTIEKALRLKPGTDVALPFAGCSFLKVHVHFSISNNVSEAFSCVSKSRFCI